MPEIRVVDYDGLEVDADSRTITATVVDGGAGSVGPQGPQGDPGQSAYEIAVDNGFAGTELEWLDSLQGVDGDDGESAYDIAVANGFVGSEADWLASLVGAAGQDGADGAPGEDGTNGRSPEFQKSATHIQWRLVGDTTWLNLVALADLKGDKGDKGDQGDPGEAGTDGVDGADGETGYLVESGGAYPARPTPGEPVIFVGATNPGPDGLDIMELGDVWVDNSGVSESVTYVQAVTAGANVAVDNADPANPVVSVQGSPLPLAVNPIRTLVNNLVTNPSAGNSVTLHTITGAGVVRNYMLTHALKDVAKKSRIQFFVDGETTPSLDVEWGTLFGLQEDAWATQGKMLANDHAQVSLSGDPYGGTSTATLLLPIPFANGLVVKLFNPSASGSNYMFSTLTYEEGEVSGLTDKYRLRSQGAAYATLAGTAGVSLPLFDVPGIAGSLVYFATAVDGVSDYSFLERPWNVYVDGETTPSYRGNAEDWWGSGFYFGGNIQNYGTPTALVTATNNANKTFYGGIDLLTLTGGIPFSSGLKMAFGASGETKGDSHWESTNFALGYAALFYVEL
jgi:hypothetical protein